MGSDKCQISNQLFARKGIAYQIKRGSHQPNHASINRIFQTEYSIKYFEKQKKLKNKAKKLTRNGDSLNTT